MMTAIVAALVALVIGIALGVMQGRAALAAKEAELLGRTENLARAMEEIAKRKTELEAKADEIRTLQVEMATLVAEKKSDEEKLKELLSAREQFANHFKALANEILEEKSKRFTELNQLNLGQLLNPLKEKLGEFQKKVEEVYVSEGKERSALMAQVENLMTLNMQISTEASNLTKALTETGKAQGDWGELILERMLEAAGLRKDQDYFVQQNFKNEEEKNVRPDILIRLPENRSLIIDSKMSFPAYNEYTATNDEALKAEALKRHLSSVRAHFAALSKKSYEDLRGLKAPDFVIMFVPLESAFLLAISSDAKLWEDAYRGGVLLVSPTNLLFVLRTVAQLWKTEDQKRHVDEIAKRGSAMYEKFVGFVEDLQQVGNRIDQAKTSYGDALSKLHTGPGNLVGQAEKMRRLGVKAKKQLPQTLLPDPDEDDDEDKSDAAKA